MTRHALVAADAVDRPDPDRPWIRRVGTGHSNPASQPTGRTAPHTWPLLVAEFDADRAEWERLHPRPEQPDDNDDDQDASDS